ncbi:unnamed protein product, partial [Owenia fusiformis]
LKPYKQMIPKQPTRINPPTEQKRHLYIMVHFQCNETTKKSSHNGKTAPRIQVNISTKMIFYKHNTYTNRKLTKNKTQPTKQNTAKHEQINNLRNTYNINIKHT